MLGMTSTTKDEAFIKFSLSVERNAPHLFLGVVRDEGLQLVGGVNVDNATSYELLWLVEALDEQIIPLLIAKATKLQEEDNECD